MTSKVCSTCKEEKLLADFNNRKISVDGKAYQCKDCKKSIELKTLYGITHQDYLDMLEAQNGRCKICGTDTPGGKGTFHVDHCHNSNKVRGLLCHKCNVGLGHFNDNISLLSAAILYLNKHHDDSAPSHKPDANRHRPSPRCFSRYCKS
jgi:hypothetical protein